jgi:uroporphyrinogen-III synthase
LLHDALIQRGARVSTLDVYRRSLPLISANSVQLLEQRWRDDGIDIVTLTSVETLENLFTLLTEMGQRLLISTPFVAASERIATAAVGRGCIGTGVLSRGADDDSIIGAIAAWHARAR